MVDPAGPRTGNLRRRRPRTTGRCGCAGCSTRSRSRRSTAARWEVVVVHDSGDRDRGAAAPRTRSRAPARCATSRLEPGTGAAGAPAQRRAGAPRARRWSRSPTTTAARRATGSSALLAARGAHPGAIVQGATRPDPDEVDLAAPRRTRARSTSTRRRRARRPATSSTRARCSSGSAASTRTFAARPARTPTSRCARAAAGAGYVGAPRRSSTTPSRPTPLARRCAASGAGATSPRLVKRHPELRARLPLRDLLEAAATRWLALARGRPRARAPRRAAALARGCRGSRRRCPPTARAARAAARPSRAAGPRRSSTPPRSRRSRAAAIAPPDARAVRTCALPATRATGPRSGAARERIVARAGRRACSRAATARGSSRAIPAGRTRTVEDGVEIVRNRRPPEGRLRRRRFEDHLPHLPLSLRAAARATTTSRTRSTSPTALAAVRWRGRTGRPAVLTYMGIPHRRGLVAPAPPARDHAARGPGAAVIAPSAARPPRPSTAGSASRRA